MLLRRQGEKKLCERSERADNRLDKFKRIFIFAGSAGGCARRAKKPELPRHGKACLRAGPFSLFAHALSRAPSEFAREESRMKKPRAHSQRA